jgi:hypothetical protein
MRKQLFFAIIALILMSCSHDPEQAGKNVKMASGPKPEPIKKFLEQNFELVHSVEAIDKNVLALLVSKFRDDQRLANPDDPFDATDVITSGHKPTRRLIVAGKSPGMWFIEYEHGGYALNFPLVIFSGEGDQWRIVFLGTGSDKSKDLNILKTSVSENKFHEEDITTGYY